MLDDLPARYQQYLERFHQEYGEVEVGTFVKYAGRLIKKMAFEEFSAACVEYGELQSHYFASLSRGDTINNVAIRLLREKAADLILKSPA